MSKFQDNFISAFKKISEIVLPDELLNQPPGLDENQYKAINQKRALSDQLHYRSYNDVEGINVNGETGGIYRMMDGRLGIIFKVNPPPYITEEFENIILSFFGKVIYDDVVVHIFTHASENINKNIDSFISASNYKNHNVKYPEVIEYLENARLKNIRKWHKESISSKADIRLRNFNNAISVLFPRDIKIENIISSANEMAGVLDKFKPSPLKPDELLEILGEIWNPDNIAKRNKYDIHRKINTQITKGSDVRIPRGESHFFIGKEKIAKTYTTDLFPEKLKPLDFQTAFMSPYNDEMQSAIPCEFVMSLSIIFSNTKKSAKKIKEKAQHNIGQLSPLPTLLKKKNPKLADRERESEDTVYYITKLGEIPLNAMLQITIISSSLDEADRNGARLIKKFEEIPGSWILREETYSMIAFQSLVYGCPLQYMECAISNLRRHDLLFKSNNAQVAPLLSDFKGFGKAQLLYFGKTGQVIQIEPMAPSGINYNFVITGPMGSGKSHWLNDFFNQLFRCGFKIRIVEIGRSFQPLCESVGGEHIAFGEKSDINFNFFTFVKTQKIKIYDAKSGEYIEKEIPHEDSFGLIIPLIGLMSGVSLSIEMKNLETTVEDELNRKNLVIAVEEAVKIAFLRQGHMAGMKDVMEALQSMKEKVAELSDTFNELFEKIIYAIRDYSSEDGKYYKYFNGINNINLDNDFIALELEELRLSKKELLPIITLAYLQRIGEEAFLDDSTPMVVGFDEAKDALENAIFSAALDDYARRFRKYKKILAIATQYIEDFFTTKKSASLYDGATYKIIMPSGRNEIEKAIDKKYLYLNEFEKIQLVNLQNYTPDFNEFCIRFKDQNIICRTKVSQEENWLFNTSPAGKDRRREAIERYNLNITEAITLLAIEDETGYSGEKALEIMRSRLNKEDFEKKEKEIYKQIQFAINSNRFVQFLFPIVNVETEDIIIFEVLSKIKTSAGIYISAVEFLDVSRKYNIYYEVITRLASEAFAYFLNNSYNFSLNFQAEDFTNDEFVEFLLSQVSREDFVQRVIFEVGNFNCLSEKDSEIFVNNIARFTSMGVRVAFDNVNSKNFNAELFLEVGPKIIKVDGKIIKNLTDDDNQSLNNKFIKFLTYGSRGLDMIVIPIHVENSEIQNACASLEMYNMQGFGIMEPLQIKTEEEE